MGVLRRTPINRWTVCKCLTYFFFLLPPFLDPPFLEAAFFFVAIMSPPSRQLIDSLGARC